MSVPHFLFISPKPRRDNDQSLCRAWWDAARKYFGAEASQHFTIYEGLLGDIDAAQLRCDCMVSPANSFGIMDGGYDLELSRVFGGAAQDPWRLTRHVQDVLRRRWRGFAPPTTCTLVDLPDDVSGPGRNPWEARVLAVVPTMRVPDDVRWHKELCYHSMWTLLVEITQWNETYPPDKQIKRVLMTGLGTGVGNVSVERCARQMVLAVKHFKRGWPEQPRWKDVIPATDELDETVNL